MKVLITWHAAVEPAYRKLYQELSLNGVELLAITPSCWTEGCRLQRFHEGAQDSGYEWMTLNTVFTDHIRAFFYPNVISLARRVLAFKPDIFHIMEEPFSASMAQFTLLRDTLCPNARIILYSAENMDFHQRFPYGGMQNFNLKRADALTVVPKEGRNIWERRGFRGTIYDIPLGIDPEVFQPLEGSEPHAGLPFPVEDNSGFKVGYLGRLAEGKGLDNLIDATHLLKKNGRSITLFLVGSGSLRKGLEEKAGTLGIAESVRFIDHMEQRQLPAFFHRIDALVLPSVTTSRWKEQFGRVLVEAMACKVPVVGSSSGEIPNVVGDAGLIFQEGDVRALCKSLDALITDEALREQTAQKGFRRVRDMYTWPAVAKKLAGIYEEVLK
ncbi:MAG: glycosyltransferase family 4 protein [Planctomycetes bacterium]|nr:glycosyltransferase family 4 protein [Planctomycetota bacterium]